MRSTFIERLECRRLVPYDENNHTMLERVLNAQLRPERLEARLLVMRITFTYEVREQDGGKPWAKIEGEAVTTITDPSIKPSKQGTDMNPNIIKVLEGALSDDVMLAVAQVMRAMRLPSPLMVPLEFYPMAPPKPAKKGKAGKKARKPRAAQ